MKTLLLTVIFSITATFLLQAQPGYQWAKGGTAYTAGDVNGQSVATDAHGNVIVAGNFSSTNVTFGGTTLTKITSTEYLFDMFLTKYDSLGNVLWAKNVGSVDRHDIIGVYAKGVSTDIDGNIYVTGYFEGTAHFGTTILVCEDTISTNIYVAKYDALGNAIWAKSIHSGADTYGPDYLVSYPRITTDLLGNVLVSGSFISDSVEFGITTLYNHRPILTYPVRNNPNIFIVKYDHDGNAIWAKGYDGIGSKPYFVDNVNQGFGIATDASNNVFLTGTFVDSAITFGSTTLINTSSLYPFGTTDVFLLKLDPEGNELWAKSAGGPDADGGQSIATDASGNVVVTGHFSSGAITFGSTTLSNAESGSKDVFVVKYDASGNVVWAKSAGGDGKQIAQAIALDGAGDVIVTGYFYGIGMTFGTSLILNSDSEPFLLTSDLFIAKYSGAEGNLLWVKNAGGSTGFYDEGNAVAVNATDNIFVTGDFTCNNISFGSTTLTNLGWANMFVVKLGNNTETGIAENLENMGAISVYPNPFNTTAAIVIKDYKNNINYQFKLYDVSGREVLQTQLSQGQAVIQKDNLSDGMYFYKVIAASEQLGTGKLIIQ